MSSDDSRGWRELLHRVRDQPGGDLVGDVWLAVGHLNDPPPRYLLGTLRNLRRERSRAQGRRARREQRWSERTELHRADAEGRADLLVAEALRDALDQLDDTDRQIALALHVGEETSQQVAHRLGIPANTVRWRLKRATEQLRVLLTPILETSMATEHQAPSLLLALQQHLDELLDAWSGRIVLHLHPHASGTTVERVDFLPPAPRRISVRARRVLRDATLPPCPSSRPFEVHFECTAD